ncbi:hypothetical protein Trydic_g12994 [Trypoxylus dichotomus]
MFIRGPFSIKKIRNNSPREIKRCKLNYESCMCIRGPAASNNGLVRVERARRTTNLLGFYLKSPSLESFSLLQRDGNRGDERNGNGAHRNVLFVEFT